MNKASRKGPGTVRQVLGTVIVASASIVATFAAGAAAAADQNFYRPPSPLPAGAHGELIRKQTLDSDAALAHAGGNWRVLYRSTDIGGAPIAVSGTVAVPAGEPPAGGWPTVSWTHGTTGTADICAPSRNAPGYPDKIYVDRINKTLDRWLARGYAVVKTDYQGLGTPGPHPYLIGPSEARSAADIVRAARQLDDGIGRDWLVMGHSQGGQAAMFAAGSGSMYTPDLNLVGAIAISPASHLKAILAYFRGQPDSQASPFLPLLMQGVGAASRAVDISQLLTAAGKKQVALADTRCIGGLRQPDAIGKLTTGEVLRTDADYSGIDHVLDDLGGSEHVYPTVPLLVLQASNDRIVPQTFTDQSVEELCDLGATVTYRSYTVPEKDMHGTAPGHRGTVEISYADARRWAAARFAHKPASSNCATTQAKAH